MKSLQGQDQIRGNSKTVFKVSESYNCAHAENSPRVGNPDDEQMEQT